MPSVIDELEKMKTVDYKGIDYGLGRTNIGKLGIRYGVIPQNEVLQAWADSSEVVYADNQNDCECCEPLGFRYEAEGYAATQNQDDCDIFILDSPYFTYAQFCSPCAPGACYLLNPLETRDENNRAFCFGHDWFEDGRAPYPVYSVKTGELVLPEVAHEVQRRD